MSFTGPDLTRPDSQLFNLKWRNYQNHIMSVFDKILLTESFSDVTLVVAEVEQDTTHAIKVQISRYNTKRCAAKYLYDTKICPNISMKVPACEEEVLTSIDSNGFILI